ncbi:MAG TPA: hypothetical protein VKX29_05605 [Brumimicrobium sp.]|nr:hypothetical protein [Brumimicrobium sp.]
MKKIITLISIITLAFGSFAQIANVEGSKDALNKSLSANFIEFVMPKDVTAENINKSAQFYTDYFTVEYNADNKVARVNLLNSDGTGRRVITRFLLSTGVRGVNFDGQDYSIMEFYTNFLE